MVMSLFRLYIPEVIQTYSHEGFIIWAIQSRIYHVWKDWFDSIKHIKISEDQIEGVVFLEFSDGGEQPENIMRVLLKIGATLPKPKNPDRPGSSYEEGKALDFMSIKKWVDDGLA